MPDLHDEALDHETPAASIGTGAGTAVTERRRARYGVDVAARWSGAEDGSFMRAGPSVELGVKCEPGVLIVPMRRRALVTRMTAGLAGRCAVLSGLCAVVSLCGTQPGRAAGAARLTAMFIVARRVVSDPFFAHSTVLILNDLGPDPAGLIMNEPTSIPVGRLFTGERRLAAVPGRVYFGGPVGLDHLWFLFRALEAPRNAVEVCPGVYLSADVTLLRRLLARAKPMAGLRIYLGHADWAPGQLQAEIAMGAWRLERVDPRAIFGAGSGAARGGPGPLGTAFAQALLPHVEEVARPRRLER